MKPKRSVRAWRLSPSRLSFPRVPLAARSSDMVRGEGRVLRAGSPGGAADAFCAICWGPGGVGPVGSRTPVFVAVLLSHPSLSLDSGQLDAGRKLQPRWYGLLASGMDVLASP